VKQQFHKNVCNGDTEYVMQLKQKKLKGAITFSAHSQNVNVLERHSTF